MELSEVVTRQHATEVVEVLKASLFDAMTDEFGNIDFSRSSGLSKAKQVGEKLCGVFFLCQSRNQNSKVMWWWSKVFASLYRHAGESPRRRVESCSRCKGQLSFLCV